MKKTISILACLAMLLASLLTMAGCGEQKNEFEKFSEKLDNYKVAMTTTASYSGQEVSMVNTLEVAGDKIHMITSMMGTESENYYEVQGDLTYTYSKGDDGKWIKDKGESNETAEDEINPFRYLFEKPENFEYSEEKSAWVVKAGVDLGKDFSGVNNLQIKIEADKATLTADMDSDGVTGTLSCVFSDFGKTKVTLPTVG